MKITDKILRESVWIHLIGLRETFMIITTPYTFDYPGSKSSLNKLSVNYDTGFNYYRNRNRK